MRKYLLVGGIIIWIIVGLAGVALLFSPKTMEENIYPIIQIINGRTIPICVGLFIMAIFRKLRPWSGIGLIFAAYILGLGWWVFSYIVTVKTLGLFWLIIGMFLAGIGVFALAFIGIIVQSILGNISFWSAMGDYLFAMFLCLIPMGLGRYFTKDY